MPYPHGCPEDCADRAGRGGGVVIFALAAASDGGTRLLCRLRADVGPQLASWLYGLLFETGDFVMMRLMLSGIKSRAEKAAAQAAAPVAIGAKSGPPLVGFLAFG